MLDVKAKRALNAADADPCETIDSMIQLLSEDFGVPEYIDSSQLMNPDKKCIRMYMSEARAASSPCTIGAWPARQPPSAARKPAASACSRLSK